MRRLDLSILLYGALALYGLWCGALGGGSARAGERLPVPEEAERREALRMIREVYGEQLASRKADDKRKLAQALLTQAEDPANDGVTRYVLLQTAATTAAEVGETETALAAVQALHEQYRENTAPLELRILERAARAAKTPTAYADIAEKSLALAPRAIQADDYDTAKDAVQQARSYARKAKDKALYESASDFYRVVREAEREYKAVATAFATVAKNPDDAEANLAVGRYLCFIKGDWAAGLPHLALGADETLAALAKTDLGAPESTEAKMLLADHYYELARAEKKDERVRSGLLVRAAGYYEAALPDLTGLDKAKAEMRLQEGAAARSATLTPTPARSYPETAEVVSFRLLDREKDLVGRGGSGRPDGVPDARFELVLDLPRDEELVEMTLSGNGVWRTAQSGNWIIGVLHEGKQLHQTFARPVGVFSGRAKLELYVNEAHRIAPGTRVTLKLSTTTAPDLTATTTGATETQ